MSLFVALLITAICTNQALCQPDSEGCPHGDVRLQDTITGDVTGIFNGDLQVCDSGNWRTVCVDSFPNTAIEIVCNQLGFLPPDNLGGEMPIGDSGGDPPMQSVTCDSTATRLIDCTISPMGLYSCGSFLSVTITCQDPMSSMCVKVNTSNNNDHTPRFTQEINIGNTLENIEPNFDIVTVFACDPDVGSNGDVMYELIPPSTMFTIDSSTGVVTSIVQLDREAQAKHSLTIQACDNGIPQMCSNTSLIINVVDINDWLPVFDFFNYSIDVCCNATQGTLLVQPVAIDRDSGTNGLITYSLTDSIEGLFTIDSTSGLISLQRDVETLETFNLDVTAIDNGDIPLSSSTAVNVRVLNCTEHTFNFINSYNYFEIFEGNRTFSTTSSSLVQVNLTTNDVATSSFMPDSILNPLSSNLSIVTLKSSEDLVMAGIGEDDGLDREVRELYTVIIVAEDTSIPTQTAYASITLRVLDRNDNPPQFESELYVFSVQENLSPGAFTGTLSTTDRDQGTNAIATFSILSPTDHPFFIIPIVGILVTTSPLDRENVSVYHLTLQASDEAGMFGQTEAIVNVEDVNDCSPMFSQNQYNFNVSEDLPPGSSVAMVTATDCDIGTNAQLVYSFVGGDTGAFSLDSVTGVVTSLISFDFDIMSRYSFMVTVTDMGDTPLSSSADLFLLVQDANNCPPLFINPPESVNVLEEQAAGLFLATFQVSDCDSGLNGVSGARFSIIGGNTDGLFAINSVTGVLITNGSLDREQIPIHNLTIMAQDSAGSNSLSSVTPVLIIVDDVNDHTPMFDQHSYFIDVFENTPANTGIINITATDIDEGQNANITYSLINDHGVFRIDELTGSISLLISPDRETTERYVVLVVARDQGDSPRSTQVELTVTILDVNDNAPIFSQEQYMESIEEGMPPGSIIVIVMAYDADATSNAALEFSLSGGDTESFLIIPTFGFITNTIELDREFRSTYFLTVTANNSASLSPLSTDTNVTITVLDINDNAPLFEQASYSTTLAEHTPIGSVVITVRAHDADQPGLNSEVVYSLAVQDRVFFNIDPDTGKVIVINTLTQGITYDVTLIVEDRGEGVKESTQAELLVSCCLVNPPVIITQPISQIDVLPSIDHIMFTVVAQGSSLFYRWLKDGLAIISNQDQDQGEMGSTGTVYIGTTTDTLELLFPFADTEKEVFEGLYSVEVCNSGGCVTSETAELDFLDPPVILAQPSTPHRVESGQNTVLTVLVAGSFLDFQWLKDGIDVDIFADNSEQKYSGTHQSDTLTINAATLLDSGVYQLFVTNDAGSVLSSGIELVIYEVPVVIYCPAGNDPMWNTHYPRTLSGNSVQVSCSQLQMLSISEVTGTTVRTCLFNGTWSPIDVSLCRRVLFEEIMEMASEVLTQNITEIDPPVIDNLITTLATATNANMTGGQTLFAGDLDTTNVVFAQTLDVLQQGVESEVSLLGLSEELLDVLNNILDDSNMQGWQDLQEESAGSQQVLLNAENYGQYVVSALQSDIVDTGNRTNITLPRENIVVRAELIDSFHIDDIIFPEYVEVNNETGFAQARIPAQLLIDRGAEHGSVAVVNTLFMNLELFLPRNNLERNVTRPATQVISTQVNSDVINDTQTSQIVEFHFRTQQFPEGYITKSPACAFWNFSGTIEDSSWSTENVNTSSVFEHSNNGTFQVLCTSNHLTSFAVLLDVTGALQDIEEAQKVALDAVTYVGCSISSFFLLATILYFVIFWKELFVKVHQLVHLNLSIALALSYLVFMIGVETAVTNRYVCVFVAAAIHYLFTASFFWMLCEGIMLYLMLVVVFSSIKKRWWIFCLLGWGTPLIIVGVSVAIIHEQYGTNTYCWISVSDPSKGAIWAFVIPVLAIICFNVFFLLAALRALYKKTTFGSDTVKSRGTAANLTLFKQLFKGTIILLPLLGLTWVFGLLSVGDGALVFAWLFTIFNSLQGLFIFIFHVLRSERVWSYLKNLCKRIKTKATSQSTKSGQLVSKSKSKTSKGPNNSDPLSLKSHEASEGVNERQLLEIEEKADLGWSLIDSSNPFYHPSDLWKHQSSDEEGV